MVQFEKVLHLDRKYTCRKIQPIPWKCLKCKTNIRLQIVSSIANTKYFHRPYHIGIPYRYANHRVTHSCMEGRQKQTPKMPPQWPNNHYLRYKEMNRCISSREHRHYTNRTHGSEIEHATEVVVCLGVVFNCIRKKRIINFAIIINPSTRQDSF